MEPLTTLERQIAQYRETVEQNPDDVSALLAFAEACLRRDQRLEALQAFQRVLQREPVPQARLALAHIFARQHHVFEAYEELRRLFEIDPANVGGHLLLLTLRDREPVPDALQPHLGFVPAASQLDEARLQLEAERDQLAAEVDQYRALTAGNDPEPILLYHLEEARKRVERILHALELLQGWAGKAGAEPVLSGIPRPRLVSPEKAGGPPEEPAPLPPTETGPAATPAAAGEVSEERAGYYAEVAGRLADIAGRIGKTRGVEATLVVADDPWLVFQEGYEGPAAEMLSQVAAGVASLVGFSANLQYWVLECEDGIVVVLRIDGRHSLLVLGRSGANFGALRYAIDKSRGELSELLAGAPA